MASVESLSQGAQNAQTDERKVRPCPILRLTERSPSEDDADQDSETHRDLSKHETDDYGHCFAQARLPWLTGHIGYRHDQQPEERVSAPR
jgi:hypothetical protein